MIWQDGNTPLIKAADCGHFEVIALLCQRGARLGAKNNVSIETSTPTVYLYTVASDDSVRNQVEILNNNNNVLQFFVIIFFPVLYMYVCRRTWE